MTDIYPYAAIAEDPTESVWVSWIDNRDAADGGEQSVEWDGGSESTTGDEVPASDAYVYHALLDGLESGADVPITIDYGDGELNESVSTLPGDADDGVTILVTSDLHIDHPTHVIPNPGKMEYMVEEDPDAMIIAGDIVSQANTPDETSTDYFMEFWRDYMAVVNQSGLIPLFVVPGNHDVGNSTNWRGDEPTDNEDRGYFKDFFKNVREMDPVGENYGAVTAGDYLQLLGFDTHSSQASVAGSFFDNHHDGDVDLCFPFHHSPLWPGGYRQGDDDFLAKNFLAELGPRFSEADNIHTNYSGHVHVEKRTWPYTVVDEEPDGDEYFDTVDGRYMVAHSDVDDGVVEWGDGYRSYRDEPTQDWYLERSDGHYRDDADEHNQFYTVDVDSDRLMITEYRERGDLNDRLLISGDPVYQHKITDAVIYDAQL